MQQRGFTLLELMVAMVIFALLAMAGWQIMDSISKSRDRAKIQIDQLSELEYTYLQLSQDFSQVSNYVVKPAATPNLSAVATTDDTSGFAPTFSLSAQGVAFIRFANPDPRYNPAPVLAKIAYSVNEGKLLRQRFYQLDASNETPTESVLLTDVKDVTWSALTPESVSNFPDAKTLQNIQQSSQLANAAQLPSPTNPMNPSNTSVSAPSLLPYQQLPKGIEIKFTYHDEPFVWRFALPAQAPNIAASSVANSPMPSNTNPGFGTNQPPVPPASQPTSITPNSQSQPTADSGNRGSDL